MMVRGSLGEMWRQSRVGYGSARRIPRLRTVYQRRGLRLAMEDGRVEASARDPRTGHPNMVYRRFRREADAGAQKHRAAISLP